MRTDAGICVDDELHLLPLVAAVDLPVAALHLQDSDRRLLPPSSPVDPFEAGSRRPD